MNYFGFDFGLRRIGVAVGQDVTGQASALCILKANAGVPAWHELDKLIEQWRPGGLVVGIPYNEGYADQKTVLQAQEFLTKIAERYSLPVFTVDEHLSSYEAKSRLKSQGQFKQIANKQIDAVAACIILEAWLSNFMESKK